MKEQGAELLAVEGLSVFGERDAILEGIDWRILKGEHWAVLGPNGCGKTTLLSAVLAYRSAGAGEIRLLGNRYGGANWHEVRKRIGMVSSAIALRVPPTEIALETVLSGATAQLGFWSRDDVDTGVAKSCLARVGVDELAMRPWRFLSQGERQKVFIARALMANPELLILDESCAGLDPVAREGFLKSVRGLAQKDDGPGLIFVTHHVEEIVEEITHVLLLSGGRVCASGLKTEVLTDEVLSQAFGVPVSISRSARGKWQLEVE